MADLHLPPAFPNDRPAGDSQRASVERFYRSATFGELTAPQAGDLLDYREFARAVIEKMKPPVYGEDARAKTEQVAIFVSMHRELATSVVDFMRRRFERGADPDGLLRAIGRFEFYEDIAAFAEHGR